MKHRLFIRTKAWHRKLMEFICKESRRSGKFKEFTQKQNFFRKISPRKVEKLVKIKIRWQPTPVFLPGESHGQRSLVGYSPWGPKELDTAERLNLILISLNWSNHMWLVATMVDTLTYTIEMKTQFILLKKKIRK